MVIATLQPWSVISEHLGVAGAADCRLYNAGANPRILLYCIKYLTGVSQAA